MSLFTELTPSEEASLSGGTKPTKKLPVISYGTIIGAGGGAGSGGTIGGGSSSATAGSGVVIVIG